MVLVGAGHAHVQVLRAWAMRPRPDLDVTLVVDAAVALYSGMVPGLIEGRYTQQDLEIDAVKLARRAGVRIILARAKGVDPEARTILIADRPPLEFDVASLDIGSTGADGGAAGVVERAVLTRPLGRLLSAIERFDELCRERRNGVDLVVVGGGAAGVELAATFGARARHRGHESRVQLLAAGPRLLSERSTKLAERARLELEDRGIAVECGVTVNAVEPAGVALAGGGFRPADLVVWAAGAAAHRDFETAGLALDSAGFLEVEETLEVKGVPGLFAVGDCAAFPTFPWVLRAGVYAVRAGPLLLENLEARLAGRPLRRWRPQRHFLALLNLGDGEALGERNGVIVAGRWVMHWKDHIDRRFVERFRLAPMSTTDPAAVMVCGGCAAKLGPSALQQALGDLAGSPRPDQVVLGIEAADDVVAWRTLGSEVVVSNLELLRAFTNDPYLFGRVAAINTLSDLDAKAVTPRAAQAIVALPLDLPEAEAVWMLRQILLGARSVLEGRGVPLLGGHTARAAELLVGFSIDGQPELPGRLLRGAVQIGDVILLTRALGSGVLLHADMAGRAEGRWVEALYRHLETGNASAAAVLSKSELRVCTDVTGFGLVGHLVTVLPREPRVTAEIELATLPALPGALELLETGERSSFHAQNRAVLEGAALAPPTDELARAALAADPQTAGGLLIVVPPASAPRLLEQLQQLPGGAERIGRIVAWSGAPVELLDAAPARSMRDPHT